VDLFTCNIFLFFFHALRLPRDLHSFPTRRSSDLTRGDGRESLNLPFPFYSKGRERKGDGLAGWKTGKKERRQRTPADVAFIFRGTSAQKPNRLNRSEEHTSELQSRFDLVCRLLLEKKKKNK